MIKVENISTMGFEGALRGMRNPMNSWGMADSEFNVYGELIHLGPNDLRLIKNLTKAGTSHRKMLRMMHIQMDVTAPLYWWKDYDTYKVATVANGCSTMHKIHAKEFTMEDFSTDHLDETGKNLVRLTIDSLNYYRDIFVKSELKDKDAWYSMIQLLPSSYMQKRTIDLNYETAIAIICDRKLHKLDEFRAFCVHLHDRLPFMIELLDALSIDIPVVDWDMIFKERMASGTCI